MREHLAQLLLVTLMRPELWVLFWEGRKDLFSEPFRIEGPGGGMWEIEAIEETDDRGLRVTASLDGHRVRCTIEAKEE